MSTPKTHNWKPLPKHPRTVIRGGVPSHAAAYEISPLGAANVELRAEVKRLRAMIAAAEKGSRVHAATNFETAYIVSLPTAKTFTASCEAAAKP